MANYMTEVAKMLGVELGEEFEIVFPKNLSCHATAVLNESGIFIREHNLANQNFWQLSVLTNLLNGNYTIKCKPWKPTMYEYYWCINRYGEACHEIWANNTADIMFYKLGNCYRTREQAEANHGKWVAFYASDEVLEV